MLTVKNISKNFKAIEALDSLNFELKKGDLAVLLGENGAGKSTLLRLICGYIEPDNGYISLDGTKIEENRLAYLQKIGYVQEVSALYGELKTLEFLSLVADFHKLPAEKQIASLKNSIRLLELENVLFQKISTLSKGFKKRVELASVLLAEPQVLLLDEPTEGLDPLQKESIRKIIKDYAKNHIVILSTHVLEDAETATRVLLLHKGNLLADCKLAEFKKMSNNTLLDSFKKVTGV